MLGLENKEDVAVVGRQSHESLSEQELQNSGVSSMLRLNLKSEHKHDEQNKHNKKSSKS